MSFEYYVNKWIITKDKLENLTQNDEIWKQKAVPVNDRLMANMLFGNFYSKYCLLYQELDNCIDQMVQPQKRVTVKKIVDAAAIRLLEFNNILLDLDLSEYHYIDGALIELKLVPYDVEILHPALFHHRPLDVEDMCKKIENGERIFTPPVVETEVLSEGEVDQVKVEEEKEVEQKQEEPIEEKRKKKPKKLATDRKSLFTKEQMEENKKKEAITRSVLLIQSAERARQERLYYLTKWIIHEKAVQARLMLLQDLLPTNSTAQVDSNLPAKRLSDIKKNAALTIQNIWKSFSVRQRLKYEERERRFTIGMYEPVYRSQEYKEIFKRNLEKRRAYRDQRIREYVQAIDNEKTRVFRVVAPGLMEDISDEIREWLKVWYKEAKLFDDYPPEEKGGTILVVRGETMTPKEYLDEYERKRREKVKAGGAKAQKEKEKKEREKLKKAEAEKKKKELEQKKKIAAAKAAKRRKRKPGEYEYDFDEPVLARPIYIEGMTEYEQNWEARDDLENRLEKHYMDIITDKTLLDNQYECRRIIDNMMRVELEILNEALDEDRVKLGLKRKGKKKPKGKKKKGKKGKKDPTGNRSIEDLFQELVDNNIIRTYPTASLEDYHGDFSYNNWEYRKMEFDPPAALLDVRQAVVMNCIIPLGMETAKRPRSVLIVGPTKSGKHILANSIFNATRSVLFDLSPERIVGKYEGGKGTKMLLHLIDKMTKILAPSIIYFDAAEKPFYKKVPKEEKMLNPKRLGSKIKKIVKGIRPTDRVLVLGLTNQPWNAQTKLKTVYERHILIPRTGYNGVYLHWRELLLRYPGIDRNFNFTALTQVTRDYPFYLMKEAVEHVLVPRRIIKLSFKPLIPEEIYEYFVENEIEPITPKIWKKFQKWYDSTNWGKQMAKVNKWANAKRAALESKQT